MQRVMECWCGVPWMRNLTHLGGVGCSKGSAHAIDCPQLSTCRGLLLPWQHTFYLRQQGLFLKHMQMRTR